MGELEDKINAVLGDPDQLGKLTRMAKSIMDGGGDGLGEKLKGLFGSSGSSDSGGEDAELLSKMGRVMSGFSQKNENLALLEAMKPYLGEKRRSKMDKAIKIARIAKLAEIAFSEYGGDDGI